MNKEYLKCLYELVFISTDIVIYTIVIIQIYTMSKHIYSYRGGFNSSPSKGWKCIKLKMSQLYYHPNLKLKLKKELIHRIW